jgi:hypothetical protein
MRIAILAMLVVGCARTAPYYTGTTEAQVRWAAAYNACYGKSDPQCEYVRQQFALEDRYERDQRTMAAQNTLDERRARRGDAIMNGYAASAIAPRPVYQPTPIFQPTTQVRCTTTTFGGTATTRCN